MKKQKNETADESKIRKLLTTISNKATRSEKTTWKLKHTNMVKIIDGELADIVREFEKLTEKRQVLLDKIAVIRADMVHTCIHPGDQLIHKGTYVECKFCNRKIGVVGGK